MAFYSFVSMAIASLLYNLHLYETLMINMHKFVQEMVAGGFVALPFIDLIQMVPKNYGTNNGSFHKTYL